MVNRFNLYNIKTLAWLVIITELVLSALFINIYFFVFDSNEEARLERPQYLWFLIAVPVFAVFWVVNTWQKNQVIQRFATVEKLGKLGAGFSMLQRYLQYFAIRNAIFLLVVGLCNPQYGTGKQEAKRSGIDLMIALDVSNSMLAEDMGPNGNRLTYAKRAIERLLGQLKGDRIGLVVFAGDAFIQIPITTDYPAAKLFLSAVSTDMISAQGTHIGRAVDKCVESFDMKAKTRKAIIVISDGEDHETEAVQAVQNAANSKINVYTIGVGSSQGSPIPNYVNGRKEGVKRDAEGNTVITRLNQEMLKQLAAAGNGVYVKTTRSNFGLDALFKEINKLEKNTIDTIAYTDYDDQYFYFIWAAFIFLLFEFLIGYLPLFDL
ncbi:MAG TPA: VWA domain-containing protein [Flavobacteriales bacterium]|nr:VWA domain-containing protein [Flavobacteriales bacterium]